ncbi:hypothetical protein KIN20_015910 [Parelaphostrongylus tenuis]|uniref:Uncharacterized protein n=1 Tax=Parelaphostrongylus tenuis TaxID=148309 RepID=A0AAD5MZ53_PARTN|nr:hypothetical protein KIN20_015910 [Parelaphostrongylus tenuis]
MPTEVSRSNMNMKCGSLDISPAYSVMSLVVDDSVLRQYNLFTSTRRSCHKDGPMVRYGHPTGRFAVAVCSSASTTDYSPSAHGRTVWCSTRIIDSEEDEDVDALAE